MLTMHVLSAGDGYTYYTSEVATGDAKRDQSRDLGDYYTAEGNPQGVWVGAGIGLLGVDGAVTESQMKALYGEGLHPDAEQIIEAEVAAGSTPAQALQAAKLGRKYYAYSQSPDSLSAKIGAAYEEFERRQHRQPTDDERRQIRTRVGAVAFRQAHDRQPINQAELTRFITAAIRPPQQAVAGFDLVAAPAKSVSVLWALGDNTTRLAIEKAHEDAMAATIRHLEHSALATRSGVNGVAQIEVRRGLVATRFRHFDSRNGDPQLHDHIVVANKVQGVDGKWRTIDSKLWHRQAVAASEYYNRTVMANVCTALGVTAEARTVQAGKRPVMEIAGVSTALIDGFSSRRTSIKAAVTQLTKQYQRDHGRAPTAKAMFQLAQQATLATRPKKEHAKSLQSLRTQWMIQGAKVVGDLGVRHVLARAQQADERLSKAARRQERTTGNKPLTLESLDVSRAAQKVLDTVSEHHSVWGPQMIEAEANRWIASHFPGQIVPDAVVDSIASTALDSGSISVTPPPLDGVFRPLARSDRTSIYEHKGRALFTSRRVLQAEDTLLHAGKTHRSTRTTDASFNRTLTAYTGQLNAGQQALARDFATNPATLSVGIGPAGAGKTTAMKLATQAVHDAGGRVIGLAPSKQAAKVLQGDIDVPTFTLDQLINARRNRLEPGDVIIIDEAGMAGTAKLARVVELATEHGAHVRLLGDDRQLNAVDAGGAFAFLARELEATRLAEVHRFRTPGEAEASLLLRDATGTDDPFRWYLDNGRVFAGSAEEVANEQFRRWQTATNSGKDAAMMGVQNAHVAELNQRAQAYRIAAGTTTGKSGVALRDDLYAFTGDIIVTRANDHTLRAGRRGHAVENGQRWSVVKAHRDGSLTVRGHEHGHTIRLPERYVSQNVSLGYALTSHGAQGATVDVGGGQVDRNTPRSAAYVMGSRGRDDNTFFVVTEPGENPADVLAHIAQNVTVEAAAHDVIREEQARIENVATLVDQYADVVEHANQLRFRRIVHQTLPADEAKAVVSSEAWGAVASALAKAERNDLSPAGVLGAAFASREIGTADDLAMVMSYRLENRITKVLDVRDKAAPRTPQPQRPSPSPRISDWLADTRAMADQTLPAVWREHLQQRYDTIDMRLTERGTILAAERPTWSRQLGDVPAAPERRDTWVRLAAEVEVFREKYNIPSSDPYAIPEKYRGGDVGRDLAARVTALHKSTMLSPKPVMSLQELAAAQHAAHARAAERLRGHIRTGPVPSSTRLAEAAVAPSRQDERAATAQYSTAQMTAATRDALTRQRAATGTRTDAEKSMLRNAGRDPEERRDLPQRPHGDAARHDDPSREQSKDLGAER